MFPYQLYKILHIVGIALVMSALGGVAIHALNGGIRRENAARGLIAGLHGLGVVLILVGGFGMLARLGFLHGALFPGWLWVKLAVWVTVAAALMLPYRWPSLARPIYLSLPVLVGLATYMAVYKPF